MSNRYSARGYGRDYGRYDREADYGGRYGRGPEYDYERGSAGREGRDFSEQAGDEVRSWFGDDEAERRRRMDEARGRREGYGSDYGRSYAGAGLEGGIGESTILVRLGDTDFDIAGDDDIRGRRVIDQAGSDIGDVDDLIVDQRRRRVRFLHVTSGGFLGIGGTMLLVPVEAITSVGRDEITVGRQGGRGAGAMRFNPTLIDRGEYGGRYGGYAAGGRHRGRGPRGYKRSDDRIRDDINDRLADDPIIDASDIEVAVVNAEVTLSGTTNSRVDKRRAEDLAEAVSGVENVQNNLRVKQREFGTTAGTTTGTTTGTTAGTAAGTTATETRRGTAAGGAAG